MPPLSRSACSTTFRESSITAAALVDVARADGRRLDLVTAARFLEDWVELGVLEPITDGYRLTDRGAFLSAAVRDAAP